MNTGIILELRWSWSSSIPKLIIEREDGAIDGIPYENSFTARALDAAFGEVITRYHAENVNRIAERRYTIRLMIWACWSGLLQCNTEGRAELKYKPIKTIERAIIILLLSRL